MASKNAFFDQIWLVFTFFNYLETPMNTNTYIAFDYYPFGMPMPGRSNSSDNPCSGQEEIIDTNYVLNHNFNNGTEGWNYFTIFSPPTYPLYANNGQLIFEDYETGISTAAIFNIFEREIGKTYYFEIGVNPHTCSVADSILLMIDDGGGQGIKVNIEQANEYIGSFTAVNSNTNSPIFVAIYYSDTCTALIDYFKLYTLDTIITIPCNGNQNNNSLSQRGNYRYGFNGKELDNEIKGEGNSLDFGDRMYDPRTGRWNKVDVKQAKYPGYSPYHFGYDNPIITIDPNGEENIVVVGNQGYSPGSDKKKGKEYRYGENKRHFLEAGLNEALSLKNNSTQNDEATTMVVYKGNYTDKEIKHYQKRAEKAGINFMVVSSAEEIENYVNDKDVNGNSRFWFGNDRDNDLITDFSFVGHGWTKALYTGYNAVQNDVDQDPLYISSFDKEAFHYKANIHLNACASGFELVGQFKKLTKGTIKGYNVTIQWGGAGLGTYEPYDKWYYPPGDPRRNDSDRPTVPLRDRTTVTTGTGGQTDNKKVNGKDLE